MGGDSRTTCEHISQYLAQLGQASSVDALKVHLFSLSLTGTAFSWFSSLSLNSISSWEQLEHKFHNRFYSSDNELKFSNLTSFRQGSVELVHGYIRRCWDTKNQCFNLIIREKDLVDLVLNGLRSYIREKLYGHTFITLTQLQQRSLTQESRSKDTKDNLRPIHHNMHYVDYDYDSSSDEFNDIYVAEFVWPSKAKSYSCDSLKPVQ
jgi:hypothetical protein